MGRPQALLTSVSSPSGQSGRVSSRMPSCWTAPQFLCVGLPLLQIPAPPLNTAAASAAGLWRWRRFAAVELPKS